MESSWTQSVYKGRHLRIGHVYGTLAYVAPLRRELKGSPLASNRNGPTPKEATRVRIKPAKFQSQFFEIGPFSKLRFRIVPTVFMGLS